MLIFLKQEDISNVVKFIKARHDYLGKIHFGV